jgi:YVTN family beta-propeller protein
MVVSGNCPTPTVPGARAAICDQITPWQRWGSTPSGCKAHPPVRVGGFPVAKDEDSVASKAKVLATARGCVIQVARDGGVSLRAFLGLTAATLLIVAILGGRSFSAAGGAVRLYVTNSLGDDITVIDLGTLKAVDDIKVGAGVHGACAPADGRWLFTTVESENNLKVIATATDKVVKTIALT